MPAKRATEAAVKRILIDVVLVLWFLNRMLKESGR